METTHDDIYILRNAYHKILDGVDLRDVLKYCHREFCMLTGSKYAMIGEVTNKKSFMGSGNKNGLYIKSFVNSIPELPEEIPIIDDSGDPYCLAVISGEIVSTHFEQRSEQQSNSKLTKNQVIVPLKSPQGVIGCISLVSGGEIDMEKITKHDIVVMKIASIIMLYKRNEELESVTRRDITYKTKSLFMANVSHEIRTPLNSIIGMLKLLVETKYTDEQKEYIEIALQASYELLGLINDILDISKLEAGKMVLSLKPVDLRDLIDNSIRVLILEASTKKIPINVNINSQVPNTVLGDAQRIRQMIINLIGNAIKFTKSGKIDIELNLATANETSDLKPIKYYKKRGVDSTCKVDKKHIGKWNYIKISVTDTGIGIKDADLGKLFQSFTQLDAGNLKGQKGVGLGLSIVSKFCELMDGKISYKSQYGVGSTFYFIIPLPEFHKEPANLNNINGIRILLLDDNPANLIHISRILEKYNMQVIMCQSPKLALSAYIYNDKYDFDVGLIDIIMPEMNGNEFAIKVRQSGKKIKLIALSSLGENTNEIDKNFEMQILKPFEEEVLLNSISYALSEESDSSEEFPRSSSVGLEHNFAEYAEHGNTFNDESKDEPTSKLKDKFKDKLKILIVDDNNNNLIVLNKMLQKIGYSDVTIAKNGKEALDVLALQQCDVVLMDILMPVMDGIECAKTIGEKYSPRPYIIAVSAVNMDDEITDGIKKYMDGLITKPIEGLEIVKNALDRVNLR